MTPAAIKLLSKAAAERRRAAIRYDGQRHLRIVEPHLIYLDDQGSVMADCYQVQGYSDSDNTPPFWKTFRLSKIEAVFLLNVPFEAEAAGPLPAGKQDSVCSLIASAYDRPSSRLLRRPAEGESVMTQTRSWWSQVESAIDELLSGEPAARPGPR